MTTSTENLRILDVAELISPAELSDRLPITEAASDTVRKARTAIQQTLRGDSDRLIAIVGPCSIHDPEAALDYARKLKPLRDELSGTVEVVMRVYFEKPRTIGGWKGLINDPGLDNSFRINDGLEAARRLLLDLNDMGMPVATEFLDAAVPQYLSDLVAWAAIGARTTESQIHRELASGLSCPVGFKNGTRGNVQIAIDAVRSAARPHHFMALSASGRGAIAATTGNPECHVILRGGTMPNYNAASVDMVCDKAQADGIRPNVMIDASHANSGKDHRKQPRVLADIGGQIAAGDGRIMGVMVESQLVEGRQDLKPGKLVYGQSITDACLGWADTVTAMRRLAEAVATRRVGARRQPQTAAE